MSENKLKKKALGEEELEGVTGGIGGINEHKFYCTKCATTVKATITDGKAVCPHCHTEYNVPTSGNKVLY